MFQFGFSLSETAVCIGTSTCHDQIQLLSRVSFDPTDILVGVADIVACDLRANSHRVNVLYTQTIARLNKLEKVQFSLFAKHGHVTTFSVFGT